MNLCKNRKINCNCFSMYSKIPMVQFEWKEEDMRYSMCFFPLVGIVIGLLSWCWWLFCRQFGIGKMCFAFVGLAIILLVTGGIHMDGYMDTMDALHSYGSREKKLEILKDSHIGAFAVIMTVLYVLIAKQVHILRLKITQLWHHFAVHIFVAYFSVQLQLSHFRVQKKKERYICLQMRHRRK